MLNSAFRKSKIGFHYRFAQYAQNLLNDEKVKRQHFH